VEEAARQALEPSLAPLRVQLPGALQLGPEQQAREPLAAERYHE